MRDRKTMHTIRAGLVSPDPRCRAESVDALTMLADVAGLRAALGSHDAYVRIRAAKALASVPGEWVTWRLARLAWDTAADVRVAVAEALGQRDGWLVGRTLRHLTADAHPVVRYRALCGLVRLEDRQAAARLRVARATDDEPWVRDAAAALLQQCKLPGSTESRDGATADVAHRTLGGFA